MENQQRERLARDLAAARKRAGSPSFSLMARESVAVFGPIEAPSDQSLANYHNPKKIPERVNVEWVAFLAGRYGTTVRALSPELAEVADARKDLLIRSTGWITPSLFDAYELAS